jgi:predicted transcriptional regulator
MAEDTIPPGNTAVASAATASDHKTTAPSSSPNDNDDHDKIEMAMKFWNHPALQNVSSAEKRAYLHERGLTDAHIHKAWDRIMEQAPESNDVLAQNISKAPPSNLLPPVAPSTNDPYAAAVSPYSRQPQLQQQPYAPSYPQPQQQPQYSPAYNSTEEDDVPALTVAKGLSLVAVGGMLGVTAAAAVRWLNGEDFELFPSALQNKIRQQQEEAAAGADEMDQEQEQRSIDLQEYYERQGADDTEKYPYEDDGECDDNEDRQLLEDKMEQLLQAVSKNTETQETLMRRLANSTFTNQSMDLLRNSQQTPKREPNPRQVDQELLLSQLTEIQKDLTKLTETLASTSNDNSQEWKDESARILEKLTKSMEHLNVKTAPEIDDSAPSTIEAASEATTLPPDFSPSTQGVGRSVDDFVGKAVAATPTAASCKTLYDCIRQIASGNDATTLKVGTQLLYLYLVNLSGKPENQRYRKIYTSNQSFPKVESLVGGRELLNVVGFEMDQGKNVLQWVPSESPEDEAAALVLVKEAVTALGVLKSGIPSAELTERALSKLSPPSTVEATPTMELPPPPPPSLDVAPQTPAGSMLVSPPATKKLPFPEGTPTNLSDLLEQSSSISNDDTTEKS